MKFSTTARLIPEKRTLHPLADGLYCGAFFGEKQ